MRWPVNFGKPRKDPYEWHIWFAWYPVKAGSTWVWLEKVRRKRYSTWASDWHEYDLNL